MSPELSKLVHTSTFNVLDAASYLESAEQAWGLVPGQSVLLDGQDVAPSRADNILKLPEKPDIRSLAGLPLHGSWFVGVQRSGSMWAALRNTGRVVLNDLSISWRGLNVPGADPLVLGTPISSGAPLTLIVPPPFDGETPARLDAEILRTSPFSPEDGSAEGGIPTVLSV